MSPGPANHLLQTENGGLPSRGGAGPRGRGRGGAGPRPESARKLSQLDRPPAPSSLAVPGRTSRPQPGEARRDWRKCAVIDRRAGRSASRASAASAQPRREWSAARGPAPGPAPLRAEGRTRGPWLLLAPPARPGCLSPAAASPAPPDNSAATREAREPARRRVRPTRGPVSTGTAARGDGRRCRPSRASVSPNEQTGGRSPFLQVPPKGKAGAPPAPPPHGDPCLSGVFLRGGGG